ncbi:MAG: hypothetical protein MZV64_16930 [Ignavibacteriales bacterium]|nr:hypothetical protein [Ignavibacteriales bacterium]
MGERVLHQSHPARRRGQVPARRQGLTDRSRGSSAARGDGNGQASVLSADAHHGTRPRIA